MQRVRVIGFRLVEFRSSSPISMARPVPVRYLSVRMSLWLSVTFMHCIETSTRILKLFSDHHRHSFTVPNVTAIFRQSPPPQMGRQIQVWYEKIATFDQDLALFRK